MVFPICNSYSRAFFSKALFPLSSFGIQLPLVGAFCVLSLGLTNLSPALIFKMGSLSSHIIYQHRLALSPASIPAFSFSPGFLFT
ncbi:hypothetical protein MRB53_020542 [Persea americana]|uniref:Uncharacterized protein n=1 Tax=Persea americana TaxID=3435 RepID=A0ACC2L1N3_PERAE|nr:hypothetical protein MRB53_020542 [Persea americana]